MKRFALSSYTTTVSSLAQSTPPAYLDPSLPAAERAHDLVGRMTLDEKASQLEDWATAIPRLGIPDYQTWNEALHGVARAGYATVFPQAIGMAATWDPSIVHAMGDVISTEARAKYNQAQQEDNHRIFYGLTFWSPNINIFRDPRWGRGQETYGEDPFLTGRMGVAFVTGVQGDDPEHPQGRRHQQTLRRPQRARALRHTFNVNPSPRDLEETYLPAFRATVIDGHVKSVMCAYNAIDDYAACANKMLLQEHFRNAWGFKGFVVSDCGAIMDVSNGHKNAPDITHAAAISIEAGTDLSCSIWAPGFNTLADAVRQGLVSEDLITRPPSASTPRASGSASSIHQDQSFDTTPFRLNASAAPRRWLSRPPKSNRSAQERRHASAAKGPSKIAVVGPTADLLIRPSRATITASPLAPVDTSRRHRRAVHGLADSLRARLNAGRRSKVPVPRTAFNSEPDSRRSSSPPPTGPAGRSPSPPTTTSKPNGAIPARPRVPHPRLLRSLERNIACPAAGHYTFSVEPADGFPYSPKDSYRLTLDGKVLAEGELCHAGESRPWGNFKSRREHPRRTTRQWPSPLRPSCSGDFTDTNPHDFKLEYSHSGDQAGGGLYFKWDAPAQAQLDEAVAAAKQSDVVVAFVGLSPQLEGEEMPHQDRRLRRRRPHQDRPARRAAQSARSRRRYRQAGHSRVCISGSAVALPWAKEHAAAVLEAWYPGVEGGTAIARTCRTQQSRRPPARDLLKSVDDLPAFTSTA